MEDTYLIQRLNQPLGYPNPYVFPGRSSGLTRKIEEEVALIWSFQYMGAAEFERGNVGETLQNILEYVQNGAAITGTVDFGGSKKVYFLTHQGTDKEVRQRIRKIYKNEGSLRLCEPCNLRDHLDGKEYLKDNVGWLELDNGFMFFTDETMYNNALNMFDYKPKSR